MKYIFAIVFVLVGSACAPIFNPPPTPTPTPVPTPTLLPFSQVNLETVLVADGDLPADLVPDIIVQENAVGSVEELDRAASVYTQYFLLNEGEGGGVSVFVFDSKDEVGEAFEKISTLMDDPQLTGLIGEQAWVEQFFIPVIADVAPIQGSRLVFARCHALAVVQFPRSDDLPAIIRYGQLLDARLQPLVCRESE